MTTDRIQQFIAGLRKAHENRVVPSVPLGFDAGVMADIRSILQEQDIMGSLLPRFTMAAMAAATVAVVYGMTLLDTVPQALAGMYASSSGFGL